MTQEKLEGFLSKFGRKFYKLPDNNSSSSSSGSKIVLERKGETIQTSIQRGDLEVGLSRAGAEVFSLRWEKA